ncbi:MAG: hypothetical protein Q7U08_01730 [Flavobacteriaceae bacterium]|nr:hypothetical protein [Flavobacteriaceae bacterium]
MQTRNLGVAIITIGIIMMIYTGLNYVSIERAGDSVSVKIDKEKIQTVQWWLPIVGLVLIVGGGMIVVDNEKNSLN